MVFVGRRRVLGPAALALGALWALGCRDLVGAGDFSVAPPKQPLAAFSATCAACVSRACSGELAACSPGSSCGDLFTCQGSAPGAGRRARCEHEHPAGIEPAGTVQACLSEQCEVECAWGASFECADAVEKFPVPRGTDFEWRLRYRDLAGAPLAGLRVRACLLANWTDPNCLTPDAEGTTDDAGRLTLRVEFAFLAVKQPWVGYLYASGGASRPELRYHSSPPLRDEARELRLLSSAEYVSRTRALGLRDSPELGELVVQARDCWGAAARDVAIEAEDAAGPLPVRLAASEAGAVEFVEVSPGIVRVRVRTEASGPAVSELSARVVAAARTVLVLEPGGEL